MKKKSLIHKCYFSEEFIALTVPCWIHYLQITKPERKQMHHRPWNFTVRRRKWKQKIEHNVNTNYKMRHKGCWQIKRCNRTRHNFILLNIAGLQCSTYCNASVSYQKSVTDTHTSILHQHQQLPLSSIQWDDVQAYLSCLVNGANDS